jgi:pectate lyase
VRFGKVHLYNNYTQAWAVYGACASVESQVQESTRSYMPGSSCK